MVNILADDIFTLIIVYESYSILNKISLKWVYVWPTDYKPSLVQVMAWRRTGDKPLPGPMMTYFTDAYIRH